IVGRVTDIMGARGAIFWIVDEKKAEIRSSVCHGFHYRSLMAVDYPALERLFDFRQRRPVCIGNARTDDRIPDLERLGKRRITTVWGIPLDIVDRYVGILAVYFGQQRNLVSSEINFLTALGEQGAIALHKALRYDERLLQTFSETVEGLALALEAKDPITHGHSQKVARYARLTAEAMGLNDGEIAMVHRAGLLHDMGKIGMQDRLLGRLGKLNTRELNTLKMHPVIGARILEPLTFLEDVAACVLNHHELWDGSGYPQGAAGEEIPMGARILSVCDAFDTMISGRPHMPAMPVEKAVLQLKQQSGTRFDPDVVAALLAVILEKPAVVKPLKPGEDTFRRFQSKINKQKKPAESATPPVLKFTTSF
ncbi:MAG: HD domain-containing protein, partial [Desulfobacterales bacterium]|nr:HD domain-containing protein [Desulfobacterales bacterium]